MPSRDPYDSAHHEKSQIQALERPGPAADAWQPQRRRHDYTRHGTTNLYAALNWPPAWSSAR